jgi:hypothetical protein
MMRLGRSKMSLRMLKQNAHGTRAPSGFVSVHRPTTLRVVFSNACSAKFSQYSTALALSKI